MIVSNIIKQVRWCIDEETGYSDFEDTYMNNIIKAKLSDALVWCCTNADESLLTGSDTEGSENLYIKETTNSDYSNGYVTLPSTAIKVLKVRGDNWHRAVRKLIDEDSEEYLACNEELNPPTLDRPQAALIIGKVMKVEVFPKTSQNVKVVYFNSPANTDGGSMADTDTMVIPPLVKSAFIYYLAFLVLSAYNDTNKAAQMLAIAKMNLGATSS